MDHKFKNISMIGLGYIGLPTAAMLASKKVRVVGVDIDQHVVDTINRGDIHIVEPELDIIVRAAVSQGYLCAKTRPDPADAFLIAVPTPFSDDHEPDLSFVEAAVCSIAPVLKVGDLVVLESTSPVGTTEEMCRWLAEARPDLTFPHLAGEAADVNVAYCPERVLPGKVVHELVSNDRIIGGMTSRCSERASELYRVFVQAECIPTFARTAEMCKLTENSFRDVNIAFANELSLIADKIGIDVWDLIRLANRHPRVNILQPGPGVGGHCIAVDPWFIVSKTPDEARLIRTARQVNDSKPDWVVAKVEQALANALIANPTLTAKDVTIACFGLAFKPDIDDLRESPALEITHKIALGHPGSVWAVEPHVEELPERLQGCCQLVGIDEALQGADILVLLVDHKVFKEARQKLPTGARLVDTRGVWG